MSVGNGLGALYVSGADGNRTVLLRCDVFSTYCTPAEAIFLARQLLAAARFNDPFRDTDAGTDELIKQLFRDD